MMTHCFHILMIHELNAQCVKSNVFIKRFIAGRYLWNNKKGEYPLKVHNLIFSYMMYRNHGKSAYQRKQSKNMQEALSDA